MTVFRKKMYKPIPKGAEVTTVAVRGSKKRIAKWVGKKGKSYSADVVTTPSGDKIVTKSNVYVARYRNEQGKVVERSTGCRDKQNAQAVLQGWLSEVEKINSGLISPDEVLRKHRGRDSIEDALERYQKYLDAKQASKKHIGEVAKRIREVCADCGFETLQNITIQGMIDWMNKEKNSGKRGAKTRNHYREAMVSFCNWAKRIDKSLVFNPIEDVTKSIESIDVRHKRRAYSVEEINRLLEITKKRPLEDALTIRRGKHKGEMKANVRESIREKLELLGIERAAIYATMIYTGFRKKELQSLKVDQLIFGSNIPFILLHPENAKNKQEAGQPMHPCLVTILSDWLKRKAEASGTKLNAEEPVFKVPDGLDKILNRDLKKAGIEKKNSHKQVLDVHALRHSHATLLAKAGVSSVIAKDSMRHSDIKLTLGVYTHLDREDVAEAIKKMPNFGETK